MKFIKQILFSCPLTKGFYEKLAIIKARWMITPELKQEQEQIKSLKPTKQMRIYYIGKPPSCNLGDLAQYYCIRNWIRSNYAQAECIELHSKSIVHLRLHLIKYLKQVVKESDIFIFQSGYAVQDIGGFEDLMHCKIAKSFRNRIVQFPTTVNYTTVKGEKRAVKYYNQNKQFYFMARDEKSFALAQKLFPELFVKLYPDIVTTFIGKCGFAFQRDGIFVCVRDDLEKYYSETQIEHLIFKLKDITRVESGDTISSDNYNEIINHLKDFIISYIGKLAHYKVVITDRFHGTIFSLASNTPVIVIKTNDHKVVMGYKWFENIYPDHIYYAENLDDAYQLAEKLLQRQEFPTLPSYFKETYYDTLKQDIASTNR